MTARKKQPAAAERPWWRDLADVEVTARVTAAVSRLFAPPEWATFHEVAFPGVPMAELVALGLPPSAHAVKRRADVLAVHCWQVGHKGPHLEAIEVKAAAADLRRELADPSKRLAVARHCTRTCSPCPTGSCPSTRSPPCGA